MIRKYFICSTFILAFIAFIRPVHADIALNDSSISLAKGEVIAKKVEKNHAYIKLAGTRWIADYNEEDDFFNFATNNVFGSTQNCDREEKSFGRVSYIPKCATCKEGYSFNEDKECVANKCDGYSSQTEKIENCDNVEKCQKGDEGFWYKCESCTKGYIYDSEEGLCKEDECVNHPYPENEIVKNCKEKTSPCKKGQHIYYGCSEDGCNPGFKWKDGYCDAIICSSLVFIHDKCPEHGKCNECKSGSNDPKFELVNCTGGHIKNGNSCVKENSLGLRMNINKSNQEVVVSVKGNYNIDWGDGSFDSGDTKQETESKSHVYKVAKNYDLYITGTPDISFQSGKECITAVLDRTLISSEKYQKMFPGIEEKTEAGNDYILPSERSETYLH